jgi:hypothetical protein
MGSPGRLVLASPGTADFLRITLKKTAPGPPHKEVPLSGGDIYHIFRKWV